MNNKKLDILKIIHDIFFSTLIIIIFATIITMAFPYFKGYSSFTVLSNSMGKTMQYGSLVYLEKADFNDIKIGDIATFKSSTDSSKNFTHRIMAIDKKNYNFTTKGDANPNNDPLPTGKKQLIGRVVAIIPFAGLPSAILQNNIALIICIVFLALWASVEIEIINVLKKKRKVTRC